MQINKSKLKFLLADFSSSLSSPSTEYCVGSSPEKTDDVVDCMMFERSPNDTGPMKAGGVDIEKGKITGENGGSLNVSEVRKRNVSTRRSGIQLEPGKTLHHHVRMCSQSDKCTEVPSTQEQLTPPGTNMITCGFTSEALTASEPHEHVRRRRREILRYAAVRYSVQLTSGELLGTTLSFGSVNDTSFYADTSGSYRSYIVLPDQSINATSRLLKNRIYQFISKGIWVASAGQVELKTPFIISLSLNDFSIPPSMVVRLVYWSTDESLWRLAHKSCLDHRDDTQTNGTHLVTRICRTQSGAVTADSVVTNTSQLYFKFETQFAAAFIRQEIHNSAPVIQAPPPLTLNGTESSRVARIRLSATDADGDSLEWFLAQPFPSRGTATVDKMSGLLTYHPYKESVGRDEIRVTARDIPSLPQVPAKNSTVVVKVHLSTSVNSPVLVPYLDDEEIDVEITETHLLANAILNATNATDDMNSLNSKNIFIFGLDYDTNDDINFQLHVHSGPSDLFSFTEKRTVKNFNKSSKLLSNPAIEFLTKKMVSLLYPVIPGEYRVKIVATDLRQHYSHPLVINIQIVDPIIRPNISANNATEIFSTKSKIFLGLLCFGAIITVSEITLLIIVAVIYCLRKRRLLTDSTQKSTKEEESDEMLQLKEIPVTETDSPNSPGNRCEESTLF